jgi:hypothetical protein
MKMMKTNRNKVIAPVFLICCVLTMLACQSKTQEELKPVMGVLDESMPDDTIRTQVEDSQDIVAMIDPYDIQQILCQHLAYTTNGEQVTLYADGKSLTTVTNTITDMGGFDDEAVWVGEQFSYEVSGEELWVRFVPGIKFVTGLVLHYEDMPTITARVTMGTNGTCSLSNFRLAQ